MSDHTSARPTVEYTNVFSPRSSFVDDVYYNENDRTLTVDLDDEIYQYHDVPKSVFDEFADADSAGTFYRMHVKNADFGPADHLGSYDYVHFSRVAPPRPTGVGMPKGLTLSPNANVTDNTVAGAKATNVNDYVLNWPPLTTTDRSESDAASAKVFDLRTPPNDSLVLTHKVVFEVDGARKTHTLKAESVDEAVAALEEIADMLDLTFAIKEVTVYFE